MSFPLQGIRLDKRHKDFELLVYASRKITDKNCQELNDIIDRYMCEYNKFMIRNKNKEMDCVKYKFTISNMIPSFISEIRQLIH
jgi:hypothetical protein